MQLPLFKSGCCGCVGGLIAPPIDYRPPVKFYARTNAPERKTEGAAGYDLRADLEGDILLVPFRRTILVPTGVHVAIPPGYVGYLFIRSSLAAKHGITLANGVGVIDSDYRGEIKVPLVMNQDGLDYFLINSGDRIAQIVFSPDHLLPLLRVESPEELDDTERGEGGFGSTGTA